MRRAMGLMAGPESPAVTLAIRGLRVSGPAGSAFCRGHDFIKRARIAAELQAAGSGVGTRDVKFVGCNAFAVVENLDGSFVVLAGVAEDVGQHHDVLELA